MTNISIITVSYNSAETLAECLESVKNQKRVNVDHILIDGGSTDDTTNIIHDYGDYLSKVIVEPDNGIYDAMNKGIKSAKDSIIGILNSDDYYPAPNLLEKVHAIFKNPLIEACYGNLKYIDASNPEKIVRYWKAGNYKPEKFYWGWMPPHPTFFVRKSVYEHFGLFNLDLGSAADYEVMLRLLLKHRINTVYIPETLVHMRTGGVSNASVSNRLKANANDRQAWKVNNLKPYPWTLYLKPLRKVFQWVRK